MMWLGAVGVLLAVPANAKAAFPGREGRVALFVDDQETSGLSRIVTVEPDGSDPIVVHTCPPTVGVNSCSSLESGAIAWSPDGRRLAAVIGDRVSVADADGSHWKVITNGDTYGREPAWSPNGRRLAFVRLRGAGVGDLVTVRPDGTGLRRLPVGGHVSDVAWSSRGQVAYTVRGQGIYSVDALGHHRRRLAANDDPSHLDWSPDGRLLLFTGLEARKKRDSTWTVTSEGTHAKVEATDIDNALWSATGRRIASQGEETFNLSRLGGGGLHTVDLDIPPDWGFAWLEAWQSVN